MSSSIQDIVERQIREWNIRAQMFRADPKLVQQHVLPSVTVAHSHGAGGVQVAKLVADELGFRLYDREIIGLVAEDALVSRQLVEALDERVRGNIDSYVFALFGSRYLEPARHVVHLVRVVSALTAHGGVVIVGRGAGKFVDRARTVVARVDAPVALRVDRLVERDKITPEEARAAIRDVDAQRAAFVHEHFHATWNDPLGYDAVLNTEWVSLPQAASAVVSLVRTRFPEMEKAPLASTG